MPNRDINIDKDMDTCTHYDGCWFEHHKCALARLERFERQNEILIKNCSILVRQKEKYTELIIQIENLIRNTVSWKI